MSNETKAELHYKDPITGVTYIFDPTGEAKVEYIPGIFIPADEARKFLTDIDTQAKMAKGRNLTKESKRIIKKARALLATLPKED